MNKALIVGLMVIATRGVSFGSVVLKAGYFAPSDAEFGSIYGGGLQFGVEFPFKIAKNLELWIGGERFSKKGKLVFTKEETRLTLIPITGGIRYRFLSGKTFSPYVGAGAECMLYKESNPIGKVYSAELGFLGKAGALVSLSQRVGVDVSISYSYCRMTPADFKINVGGIAISAGFYLIF